MVLDWYCCPRFDSPSVFAAILDADRGGLFRISPDCDDPSSKQLCLPETYGRPVYHDGWIELTRNGDVLGASLLLMPLCKFIAPTDPRWISTLDDIAADLVSDSLVYRYDVDAAPDGPTGEEATFSLCSYANHAGLYSEETGPTGGQLGDFAQAFTHLALISAAYDLDRRLG